MPSKYLGQNYRGHWRPRHREAKKLRGAMPLLARAAGLPTDKVLSYQLHFIFPDNRRRDLDNFISRCKSALDGLADYLGQDDCDWGMEAPSREIVKGRAEVKITLKYKVDE